MKPEHFFSNLRRVSWRHLTADLALLFTSAYFALYLRVGPDSYAWYAHVLNQYILLFIGTRVVCLILFGCYSVMWRYISIVDAARLARAIALSTAVMMALTVLIPSETLRIPRSVFIIDALLAILALTGVRLFRRSLYEGRSTRAVRSGKRTLIYGAGKNGRTLEHRFKSDPALDTHVVGYIDDDPKKANLVLSGIPVLGTKSDLQRVIEKFEIRQLVVAVADLPGDLLRDLVMVTRPYGIKPRITTALSKGKDQSVEIYREVELTDLLNRARRDFDLTSVREMTRGKRVLVTGAGGSIGSELARQIMSHEPGRLLLLDHSEYNLYEIDNELRTSTHDTEQVVPLLIDLKDENSVKLAIKEFQPEVVFHAAAYKHVHLVENNPYPSILNNVLGTKILLDACVDIGVETFVQISTDKAVNPAGIMGATKRACEFLVTACALETGKRYCSVRFGNVLGSSGSLIPLLKNQIQSGGPVTVTHPEMTRFFMLIPEAVSLVLKAATIARPGDINVLRMGEPVKILDIARSLIALMDKTEEEVPIVFTGLRPGEKMYEELYIRGDELKTEHPDILTLPNGDSNLHTNPEEIARIRERVTRMIKGAHEGSKSAIIELNEIVKSNYVPSEEFERDDGRLRYFPTNTNTNTRH